MKPSKLLQECLCNYCAGCNKLKIENFIGTYECKSYRPKIKRVWCADEVIEKYSKTGKISR